MRLTKLPYKINYYIFIWVPPACLCCCTVVLCAMTDTEVANNSSRLLGSDEAHLHHTLVVVDACGWKCPVLSKQSFARCTSGNTHRNILGVSNFFVGEEAIAIIWAMYSPAGVDGASAKSCNKMMEVGQNHRESTDGVEIWGFWICASEYRNLSKGLCKIYFCLRIKYPIHSCNFFIS